MQFSEKIAFAAATGVFVLVCLGFAAAGLGVDYSAKKAIDWVGAIGSGLGGIGAASAAFLSVKIAQESKEGALRLQLADIRKEAYRYAQHSASCVNFIERNIEGIRTKAGIATLANVVAAKEQVKTMMESHKEREIEAAIIVMRCDTARTLDDVVALRNDLMALHANILTTDDMLSTALNVCRVHNSHLERIEMPRRLT